VCPGNNESAGKRKSSRIPKGNVYLKTALVEAANAAAKAKGTYLRDKFYRLKARRGYKRAAVAVAHKILVAIYHMFSHQVCYNELGDAYLDKRNKHHLTRNLVHPLGTLRLYGDAGAESGINSPCPRQLNLIFVAVARHGGQASKGVTGYGTWKSV